MPAQGLATVLGVVLMPMLAGCATPVEGPVFVLHLHLDREPGGPAAAEVGPHCGTARVGDGSTVKVERDAFQGAAGGRDGLLVVLPELGPGWTTMGSEGYPAALPAAVDATLDGGRVVLAQVGHRDGAAVVGDRPVPLPHEWEARGNGWRAALRLEEGPHSVRLFRGGECA